MLSVASICEFFPCVDYNCKESVREADGHTHRHNIMSMVIHNYIINIIVPSTVLDVLRDHSVCTLF